MSRPEESRRPRAALLRLGWTALAVLVLLALLWPWYSYRVQAYLLGRDLQAVGEALQREGERAAAQSSARQREAQLRRNEAALRRRLAGVSVRGASGSASPVVIVVLGDSNPQEARDVICAGAERLLGRSLAGVTLRVQAHRGAQPALDAGSVRCAYGVPEGRR